MQNLPWLWMLLTVRGAADHPSPFWTVWRPCPTWHTRSWYRQNSWTRAPVWPSGSPSPPSASWAACLWPPTSASSSRSGQVKWGGRSNKVLTATLVKIELHALLHSLFTLYSLIYMYKLLKSYLWIQPVTCSNGIGIFYFHDSPVHQCQLSNVNISKRRTISNGDVKIYLRRIGG